MRRKRTITISKYHDSHNSIIYYIWEARVNNIVVAVSTDQTFTNSEDAIADAKIVFEKPWSYWEIIE